MLARPRHQDAAGLVQMPIEEMAGEAEAGADVVEIRIGVHAAIDEEARQRQQPVEIGLGRRPADRPPRLRRHVAEVPRLPAHRAARQIEPEAELFEERHFEAHHQGTGDRRGIEMVEHDRERRIEAGMGIALRQQAQMGGERREAETRDRALHDGAGTAGDRLDREGAELFVEAGAPTAIDGVARLENGLEPPRAPTAHEAEMAAVGGGHQLDDDIPLAQRAGRQHDAFVMPFHGPPGRLDRSCGHAARPGPNHVPE